MMLFFIYIWLLGILLYCKLKKISLLSPLGIVYSLWFILINIYNLFDIQLYPLSDSFYLTLTLWLVGFFVGCNLISHLHVKKNDYYVGFDLNVRNLVFKICLLSQLFVIYYIGLIGFSRGGNIFFNLRSATTWIDSEYHVDYGILPYFGFLTWVIYAIEVFTYNGEKKNLRRIYILFCCNLSYAFLVVAKTAVFYLILPTLLILGIKKKISPKMVIKLGTVMFLFFVIFQCGKFYAEGSDILNISQMMFIGYMLGGMPAMDQVLQENVSSGLWGEHTFSSLYKMFNSFGIDFQFGRGNDFIGMGNGYAQVGDGYALGPFYTNVYTALFNSYVDFGFAGVFLFALFTGLLASWVYKCAVRKHTWAVIVYAHIATSLSLQFFTDSIFGMFSQTIQLFFWSILLAHIHLTYKFKLLKKHTNKRILENSNGESYEL